jgi:hypothetical protein
MSDMSEDYGSISSKIRKYLYGLMYVALAGFILSSITYIVTTIPETEIETGKPTTRTYTETRVADMKEFEPSWIAPIWGLFYFTYYDILLDPPAELYKYVIVFKVSPSIIYVLVYDDQGYTLFWDFDLNWCCRYTVNNIEYYFIEWDRELLYIDILSSEPAYSEKIYVYTVPTTMTIPFPLENPTYTVTLTVTEYPVKLSNKTVFGLIVFVASIFIVLKALSYFDINL